VFETFYSKTTEEAAEKTGKPFLPRYKKRPRRFLDWKELPTHFSDPNDAYHGEFILVGTDEERQLESQMEQPSPGVTRGIEKLLIESATNKPKMRVHP